MKLGFVGFGAQAQENLVPCCLTLAGVEVLGICDQNPARRQDALKMLPSARVFSDAATMMDSCDLDAVVVACYPSGHYEIACQALDRRLPVFVEKPPAPSIGHLDKMIESARHSGVTTGVGMNFRYASVTKRLKALCEEQVNSVTLRHFCSKPTTPFWDHTCLLKSFLYSQSIHSLDFLINLCGTVRQVTTVGENIGERIVLTIVLTFQNGVTASLVTSNTCPHFVFDFDVIAMGSRLISSSALWSITVSEVGKAYHLDEAKRWSDSWEHSPLASGFERSGYAGQMNEFICAVREQRESEISFASVRPVYNCMAIIEEQMAQPVQALSRIAS
ncbi:Gfo/Idh/MocA family protein [Puniceibacterium sediminis]|uniref:Predicted dehydrogenase n=1 Tax=Puniceibacterium sediminis TaxID=1608407 RepID=A0A238ZUF1_9RHOB|nr:Gfo/Idh/MocA family oxidoreductase [Puniceibacterium sediminis]SNR86538.1 Predicted dehydrogenase [Puniceibacterium sediminis]